MNDAEDTKIELSLSNIEYDMSKISEWLGFDTEPEPRLDDVVREQTAATILAALLGPVIPEDGELPKYDRNRVAYAVALADALRAELAKVAP